MWDLSDEELYRTIHSLTLVMWLCRSDLIRLQWVNCWVPLMVFEKSASISRHLSESTHHRVFLKI
jgi:hypothetical protein